jgi:MFS family permease
MRWSRQNGVESPESAGLGLPLVSNPGPAPARRPLVGLVVADVISTTGTEMTAVALPWFVLVTTGSPARMGIVLAAEYAGLSLLGLAGARVATAVGPRRLMQGSDLSRAALIAAIPVLSWLGWLSFPVILAIGFVVGGFFPAYQSSSQMISSSLVSDDELRLTRLGGLLNSVNESASFAGPALGGVLVAAFGPPTVLLVDAASYLCAFALIGLLVRADPPAPAGEDDDGSIAAGLRYLWRSRSLRRLMIGVGVLGIAWTAMVGTVPVLALHHGGASEAGWLLGAYGAGSVLGGLILSRARSTGGRTALLAVTLMAAAAWVLLLPAPPWVWGLAIGAIGVASGLFYPRFFASLTTTTPSALRARVLASVTIVISAPAPLGFIGAGFLAQHSTVASRLLIGAAATLGAALVASTPLASAARAADDRAETAIAAGPDGSETAITG